MTSITPEPWKVALWARDSIEPAMLRVPIILLVFLILWAFNIWIWEKCKLNYHIAFNNSASVKANNIQPILWFSGLLILIYFINLFLFTHSMGLTIEFGITIFYLLLIFIQFIPSFPGYDLRLHFYRLFKLLLLPNSTITFPEILIADALTSLSKVFKDFGTTLICLYVFITKEEIINYHNSAMILVALMASFPFWIRVRQCYIQLDSAPDMIAKIPIYLNILKYFSAFPPIWLTAAASLGYHHPQLPWMLTIAATVNSMYSYLWDLIMDWGLITIYRDGRIVLRQVAMFPMIIYIFFAIINLIFRFSWMINRLPGMNHIHSSIIVLVIEIGEIIRRSLWNILRVEWEVINQQIRSSTGSEKR